MIKRFSNVILCGQAFVQPGYWLVWVIIGVWHSQVALFLSQRDPLNVQSLEG
jgi:hypothetical protein